MNQPPVQIMTQGQHHYSNQNSYSTQGQSNVSASYVAQQQGPQSQHQGSNYHQSYSSNNPQVFIKFTELVIILRLEKLDSKIFFQRWC